MIHMRVKVPSNIAGGSLMGAHRFVKSALARANPGGSSSDYKIQATDGTPLTLSDLAARKYDEVLIISGVKSNPSTSSYPVLQPDFNYPSYESRNIRGNDLARLLPKDIDGSMLERLSAEVGTFSALNTITRLMYTNDIDSATKPEVAAMIQRYANATRRTRSNPGRPFFASSLNDTYKGILSPEEATKAFAEDALGLRFAKDSPNTAEAIDKAKIVNMYGLSNKAAIDFVDHVLTPYLAISDANRMLLKTLRSEDLRTEVGKNIFGTKRQTLQDIDSVHSHHLFKKMTSLIPTKAANFYDGLDYALVAHPVLARESVAQAVIDGEKAKFLIELVKKHPQMAERARTTGRDKSDKGLNRAARKLRKNLMSLSKAASPSSKLLFDMAAAQKEIMGSGDLEKVIDTMKKIQDPTVRDQNLVREAKKMEFRDLILYVRDLGGFRPTAPPYWPRPVVLSLMDAIRERWEVVSDGSTDFASVFMGLNTSDARIRNQITAIPHKDDVFMMNLKLLYNLAEDVKTIRAGVLQEALTNNDNKNILKSPFENGTIKNLYNEEVRPGTRFTLNTRRQMAIMAFLVAKSVGDKEYFTRMTFNDNTDYDSLKKEFSVLIEQLAMSQSARLRTEVGDHPKAISILSLFMDIEDRARNQYNYNMTENDRAFALYLLETTFALIRERTPGAMGTIRKDREAIKQLTNVLEGYSKLQHPESPLGKIELENRIRFEKEIATMESEMSRLAVLGHIDDEYVNTYFDTIVSHNNLPQFAKKRIEEAKSLVKSRIMFVEGPAGLPMPPEGDA